MDFEKVSDLQLFLWEKIQFIKLDPSGELEKSNSDK